MNETLILFGSVTAVGTAILTVGAVWQVLTKGLREDMQNLVGSVTRLEARIEASEARREADIKDVWKHLAQAHAGIKEN